MWALANGRDGARLKRGGGGGSVVVVCVMAARSTRAAESGYGRAFWWSCIFVRPCFPTTRRHTPALRLQTTMAMPTKIRRAAAPMLAAAVVLAASSLLIVAAIPQRWGMARRRGAHRSGRGAAGPGEGIAACVLQRAVLLVHARGELS